MDDKIFEKCTNKLLKMAECMKDVLVNIKNVDENELEEFKSCLEFIHEKVNNL